MVEGRLGVGVARSGTGIEILKWGREVLGPWLGNEVALEEDYPACPRTEEVGRY